MMTFTELKTHLENGGWMADTGTIDKKLIECRRCRNCNDFLEYHGFADSKTSLAFGACERCDFVQGFLSDQARRLAKGKISPPIVQTAPAASDRRRLMFLNIEIARAENLLDAAAQILGDARRERKRLKQRIETDSLEEAINYPSFLMVN